MSQAGELRNVLICHPRLRSAAVQRIDATVRRTAAGTLELTFRLYGDLSQIRVPGSTEPARADFLWQHTCFEAFIGAGNTTAYHELNLSPSGEWAIYEFRDYREIAALGSDGMAPHIAVHTAPGQLELEAKIASLPEALQAAPWRVGLCAVIEEVNGSLSYWSLRHAAGPPDFHHAEAFALVLEPPRPST